MALSETSSELSQISAVGAKNGIQLELLPIIRVIGGNCGGPCELSDAIKYKVMSNRSGTPAEVRRLFRQRRAAARFLA
jgi:hypothetical protein